MISIFCTNKDYAKQITVFYVCNNLKILKGYFSLTTFHFLSKFLVYGDCRIYFYAVDN